MDRESKLREAVDAADKFKDDKKFKEAEESYTKLILDEQYGTTDEVMKLKEHAIYSLSTIYSENRNAQEIMDLLKRVRPIFDNISKAKTAKIVRHLIDQMGKIPDTHAMQINICKESIEWATETKRRFLRQKIQTRLGALYLETRNFNLALEVITKLVYEIKRLDDKLQLVEVQLIESQIHHALKDIPKSKATLTSARSSANAVYTPPSLQTQLDVQSGILHAEEKDYKIGYSYFYEAFEGYHSLDEKQKAEQALKYMLMCKIMTNNPEDVNSLLTGKMALAYTGRSSEAMRAVASAYKKRSVEEFEKAKQSFKSELEDDPFMARHLQSLYDTLLEQNFLRLVEPFSRVEISHLASLIKLDKSQVEKKLSQMILDKKFDGILDQGSGHLIIYQNQKVDVTYDKVLNVMDNLSSVVNTLYKEKLSQL